MMAARTPTIAAVEAPTPDTQKASIEENFFHQLHEQAKTDPLIGAKVGSKEITQRLLSAMRSERGVHVDSLLCALGALAGYACQAAVRADALAQGLPELALLTTVQTSDGRTYYFGDQLNAYLAGSPLSVWSIAGGGAEAAGCTRLPDIAGIFKRVSAEIGSETFGVPHVPDANKAGDLPLNFLRGLWPALTPVMTKFCPDRRQWPVLLALSAQEVIIMGKAAIEPGLALTIVMESAVPMSKVQLDAVGAAA